MAARPKQDDLSGIEGPGVSPIKIKELDRLGDRFIENRDAKADLAKKLTKLEGQMAEIMEENGIARYSSATKKSCSKRARSISKLNPSKSKELKATATNPPLSRLVCSF